jgi:alcohol dehydrogenase class IV
MMPRELREVGVKEEDISALLEDPFGLQVSGLENNPRDVSRVDARKILEIAR